MEASTVLLIIGFILLFVPIPPIATISGALCIAAGGLMKLVGDS